MAMALLPWKCLGKAESWSTVGLAERKRARATVIRDALRVKKAMSPVFLSPVLPRSDHYLSKERALCRAHLYAARGKFHCRFMTLLQPRCCQIQSWRGKSHISAIN